MIDGAINGMALTKADTFLPGASLSHVGGSLFGLSTLAVGGRLLIPRGCEGPEILPMMRELRPTVLWMLPAALIALVRDHCACVKRFCFGQIVLVWRGQGIRGARIRIHCRSLDFRLTKAMG